jgi:hypothetical protein
MRRGTAAMVSKCHGGKGRGKGKTGRQGSSPQDGAPAEAHGNRGLVTRRQQQRPRCGGEDGGAARVHESRWRLQDLRNLGHGTVAL